MELKTLSEYLDQLILAISEVVRLDITILDINLNRIVGTGGYKFDETATRDCRVRDLGTVSGEVIQSRKMVINMNVSEKYPHIQYEKAVMLFPIEYDDMLIGVIGFVAFSDDQRQYLKSNLINLQAFMEKFTSLIVTKLREKEMIDENSIITEQLRLLFEMASGGLILIDGDYIVKQINEKALLYLGMTRKNVIGKKITNANIISMAQETFELDEENNAKIESIDLGYEILCNIKPINIYGVKRAAMITLMEASIITEMASKINGDNSEFEEGGVVSRSKSMNILKERIEIVSQSDSTVLITGESGTGKELLAKLIHSKSNRKKYPFISINCAAIPETLLESELFGYEDGAFSGAKKGGKVGRFLQADKGTIFLDEIGDMPLILQTKLLRVIQEKVIDRIGGEKPIEVDIRIIAATNCDLLKNISENKFRLDLYYRLNVIPMHIPPLRERKEDIPVLTNYFIKIFNKRMNKNILGISNEVISILSNYDWPGNVRELQNCIEYIVNFEKESIVKSESLPSFLLGSSGIVRNYIEYGSLKNMVENYTNEIFTNILEYYPKPLSKENVQEICEKLKISRATFYRKYTQLNN